LQQTPSVQKPDAHSSSLVHTAARGFLPQLPFTHFCPVAQSVSASQLAWQLFVAGSQPKGAQIVAGPGLHAPLPSQTSIWSTAAPSQVPGWQTVPARCLRQPPCPSQAPSRPQVATSEVGHALSSRGRSPDGRGAHVPAMPTRLHALQASVHAVSQQTPSAQNPLRQSLPHVHACPFATCIPPVPWQLGCFDPLHPQTTINAATAQSSRGDPGPGRTMKPPERFTSLHYPVRRSAATS
jgi:hypothetical protein